MHYAQRLSKVSKWDVQNVFGVEPSVSDGGLEPISQSESATPNSLYSTGLQSVGVLKPANAGVESGKREKWKIGNLEMYYVQRLSKVSEWAVQNGRMGSTGNENGCARSVSKVSECLSKMSKSAVSVLSVDGCLPRMRDAGRVSKMRMTGVQNGFGVVPSVSDGGLEPVSQSESATPENILHTGVSRSRGRQNVV